MQERLVRGWTVQGRTICGDGSGPQARSPIGSVSDGFSYMSLSFDESILRLASSPVWVTWCALIMVLPATCTQTSRQIAASWEADKIRSSRYPWSSRYCLPLFDIHRLGYRDVIMQRPCLHPSHKSLSCGRLLSRSRENGGGSMSTPHHFLIRYDTLSEYDFSRVG